MGYFVCILGWIAAVLCCVCSTEDINVRWYRTAQNTTDLMTRQADVQFGADFSLDQVVEVKR